MKFVTKDTDIERGKLKLRTPERWQSGRMRRFAKPLYGLTPVPRVRIPPSPPLLLLSSTCKPVIPTLSPRVYLFVIPQRSSVWPYGAMSRDTTAFIRFVSRRSSQYPPGMVCATAPSPSQQTVDRLPAPVALVYMFVLDLSRPFHIARLRSGALHGAEYLTTLGGLLPTRHRELERAIAVAREEAALSKRILFLSRSQQVFHLWHVVHKPFSYTFAVLVLVHIGVVLMMGFF